MGETRLEKYKKYRESLNEVKANSRSLEANRYRETKVITDVTNTTSTLPLEEVLGKIDEEREDASDRVLTQKKIKICILSVAGILLLAGIVIFAMIAFGGN